LYAKGTYRVVRVFYKDIGFHKDRIMLTDIKEYPEQQRQQASDYSDESGLSEIGC
jgi:hypothetical protein